MKAKNTLSKNETAVMIFTDGRNLVINDDGTGESGVWVVKKDLFVDKVIIYLRNKSKNSNEIFVGDFRHLEKSNLKGYERRFRILFNNLEYKGTTDENWNGFTETKRGAVSPIKYIK